MQQLRTQLQERDGAVQQLRQEIAALKVRTVHGMHASCDLQPCREQLLYKVGIATQQEDGRPIACNNRRHVESFDREGWCTVLHYRSNSGSCSRTTSPMQSQQAQGLRHSGLRMHQASQAMI